MCHCLVYIEVIVCVYSRKEAGASPDVLTDQTSDCGTVHTHHVLPGCMIRGSRGMPYVITIHLLIIGYDYHMRILVWVRNADVSQFDVQILKIKMHACSTSLTI